jgi:CheY-like chemotaxis protein
MQVGRFSRLKFKFATSDLSINEHIKEDTNTNRLEFNNSNDINYQIIKNLLDKFNGKITIIEKESTTLIELSIDQRLLTEYDILSKREENKNIDIKYGNYSNKRLLIVDNNNVKIKELKTLLKPYNVDVQSANSSSQMSELLNKNVTYDMILIDDIIPDFKISDYSNEIVKSKDSIINYIKMTAKYSIITIIMLNPNTSHMEKEYLDYCRIYFLCCIWSFLQL